MLENMSDTHVKTHIPDPATTSKKVKVCKLCPYSTADRNIRVHLAINHQKEDAKLRELEAKRQHFHTAKDKKKLTGRIKARKAKMFSTL